MHADFPAIVMATDGNAMIASIVSQTASPRLLDTAWQRRDRQGPLLFVFVCDKKSDWKVVVMLEVQGKVDGGW